MKSILRLAVCSIALLLFACDKGDDSHAGHSHDDHSHGHDDHSHGHDDHGHSHDDHSHSHDDHSHSHDDHGHSHDDHDDHGEERPLGTAMVGPYEIEAAQGHGFVEPGKLCHIVVKLPYSDDGASIVRAWIGTLDRDLYLVERADYSTDHDDYDVHVEAPDPLPDGATWWVEIEKPDGMTYVGPIAALMGE